MSLNTIHSNCPNPQWTALISDYAEKKTKPEEVGLYCHNGQYLICHANPGKQFKKLKLGDIVDQTKSRTLTLAQRDVVVKALEKLIEVKQTELKKYSFRAKSHITKANELKEQIQITADEVSAISKIQKHFRVRRFNKNLDQAIQKRKQEKMANPKNFTPITEYTITPTDERSTIRKLIDKIKHFFQAIAEALSKLGKSSKIEEQSTPSEPSPINDDTPPAASPAPAEDTPSVEDPLAPVKTLKEHVMATINQEYRTLFEGLGEKERTPQIINCREIEKDTFELTHDRQEILHVDKFKMKINIILPIKIQVKVSVDQEKGTSMQFISTIPLNVKLPLLKERESGLEQISLSQDSITVVVSDKETPITINFSDLESTIKKMKWMTTNEKTRYLAEIGASKSGVTTRLG